MSVWDTDCAVDYLNKHASDHSLGRCAEFVRKAIEAGGLILFRHTSAKDYGSSLLNVSFVPLPKPELPYRAGDVAIIQPIVGQPDGHMTMFNGAIWISDFKQLQGIYPGSTYRKLKPPFIVYRYAFNFA
jgi:hypothetical protein